MGGDTRGEGGGGCHGDGRGGAGLTLVAVREEVGARAQVVAVEAVDGHGGVLAHATPEPAHGGERRAASASLAPPPWGPASPVHQPIVRRTRLLPAYQTRGGRGGNGRLKGQWEGRLPSNGGRRRPLAL